MMKNYPIYRHWSPVYGDIEYRYRITHEGENGFVVESRRQGSVWEAIVLAESANDAKQQILTEIYACMEWDQKFRVRKQIRNLGEIWGRFTKWAEAAAACHDDVDLWHAPSECHGVVQRGAEKRLNELKLAVIRETGRCMKEFKNEIISRTSRKWFDRMNHFGWGIDMSEPPELQQYRLLVELDGKVLEDRVCDTREQATLRCDDILDKMDNAELGRCALSVIPVVRS